MRTDASPNDRCSGVDAAPILGIPYPNSFNRTRRLLQRVWNPATGCCEPYPDFLTRAEERAFNRKAVLVIPEWGGHSYHGSDWTYSRSTCERWAGGHLTAGNGEPCNPASRGKPTRGGSRTGAGHTSHCQGTT